MDKSTSQKRGFAAVGLHSALSGYNVGGALRAAYCYGASLVAVSGPGTDRVRHQSDTPVTWRSVPVLRVEDLRDVIPYGAIPVAVDLVEGAEELHDFTHPRAAFYIFGPENGTLGKKVLDWCPRRVMVPTQGCMNLAATVNVVLYDRLAKQMRNTSVVPGSGLDAMAAARRGPRIRLPEPVEG